MSHTVYVVQSHCGDYYCEGEHTEGIYGTLAGAMASYPLEWRWRTWLDGGCWTGENAEGRVDIVEQQYHE